MKSLTDNQTDLLMIDSPQVQAATAIGQSTRKTATASEPPVTVDEDELVRITRSDITLFTRQLASLLAGGMQLSPALSALSDQFSGSPLSHLVAALQSKVQAGASFSEALRGYERQFEPLYVSLVQAGQAGGHLDATLEQLAVMRENRDAIVGQVRAAVVYPALMAIVAVAVVCFLMAYVIPGIGTIFSEMDRQLPWITRVLITISDFVQRFFWYLVSSVASMLLIVTLLLKRPAVRLLWDRTKLRLPMAGTLFLQLETIRFCRTLGVLLQSGVSVLKALNIVQEVVQNRYLADKIGPLRRAIGDGSSIAGALRQCGLFDPIVYHTVAVGEMGGQLEAGLSRIAAMTEKSLQRQIRLLTSLLEPAIVIVMGMVVGFIVLAMLLPIFEMNQSI